MKKIVVAWYLSMFILSCEEAVDLEITDFQERYVIEANFEMQRDSSFSRNILFIRKTSPFFEEEWRNVDHAHVSIRNTQNDSLFEFEYFRNGIYSNRNLVLKEDIVYELRAEIAGELFYSAAKAVGNVPIDTITYVGDVTFEEEQFAEFNIRFTDRRDERNYYLFELDYANPQVFDDSFFAGQAFNFAMFKRRSDIIENQVIVHSYGIDKPYYNYLSQLIELNNPRFYGPFSTPPPSARGNIVNLTDQNNPAFGYFQIAVVYDKRFTFAAANVSLDEANDPGFVVQDSRRP